MNEQIVKTNDVLRGKTFFSFFRSSTALGLETQLKTKVVGKVGVSEPGGRRGAEETVAPSPDFGR